MLSDIAVLLLVGEEDLSDTDVITDMNEGIISNRGSRYGYGALVFFNLIFASLFLIAHV